MQYIYDYLYLSLAFLVIISYRYFSQKQFPGLRNRLFGAILVLAVADIVLDILSSVVITHALEIPVWLVYLVCYLYYAATLLFPLMLLLYICSLAKKSHWLRYPKVLLLIFPFVLSFAVLLMNIFTDFLFYVDPVKGYIHTPSFIIIYIHSILYIVLSYLLSFYFRKLMIPIEYRTILSIITVITAMIIVQYLDDRYLVSGASIALAVTVMYIVMQKPEDMIDAVSHAFNNTALMIFTENRMDEGKSFSMIVLELLYMRRINRIFGVDFGSKTLEAVSREMQACAHGGWLFRTIGNIFVLTNSDERASKQAYDEICARFAKDIVVEGVPMSLTATILSLGDIRAVKTVEDLNECIESALNTTSRGEHRIIPAEMLFSDQRREAVEDILITAVNEGKIKAALQPIYSVKKKCFRTAEALARYHHDTMGDISPSEFIPIAEKNGMIHSLDMQVIRRVCSFLKSNADCFDIIEINLSPVEFINDQVCSRIIDTVSEFNVDPSKIWFEITETGANTDNRLISASMNRLREAGFRFALDDYGVGYSNISRIVDLPFSLVKIDRSMMLASMEDNRRAAVMKSTVTMLHDLGLETLVEGVETAEQAELMTALDIDYIQGFYYARPMPPESACEFVMSQSKKEQ